MRYAEDHKILGSILIGVCYTDLGYESERQSGYYDGPWKWDRIKNNQRWIIQFASTDDPFIPIEEARFIHEHLDSDYHEYTDQAHFGHGDSPKYEFPDLIAALKQKMI
jgi:predicted alpha/beta hydrolase family esterase